MEPFWSRFLSQPASPVLIWHCVSLAGLQFCFIDSYGMKLRLTETWWRRVIGSAIGEAEVCSVTLIKWLKSWAYATASRGHGSNLCIIIPGAWSGWDSILWEGKCNIRLLQFTFPSFPQIYHTLSSNFICHCSPAWHQLVTLPSCGKECDPHLTNEAAGGGARWRSSGRRQEQGELAWIFRTPGTSQYRGKVCRWLSTQVAQ